MRGRGRLHLPTLPRFLLALPFFLLLFVLDIPAGEGLDEDVDGKRASTTEGKVVVRGERERRICTFPNSEEQKAFLISLF